MKVLSNCEIGAVNGGNSFSESAGYMVGYTVGFLGRAAGSIGTGSAGYRIGIAIYNVLHKSR